MRQPRRGVAQGHPFMGTTSYGSRLDGRAVSATSLHLLHRGAGLYRGAACRWGGCGGQRCDRNSSRSPARSPRERLAPPLLSTVLSLFGGAFSEVRRCNCSVVVYILSYLLLRVVDCHPVPRRAARGQAGRPRAHSGAPKCGASKPPPATRAPRQSSCAYTTRRTRSAAHGARPRRRPHTAAGASALRR